MDRNRIKADRPELTFICCHLTIGRNPEPLEEPSKGSTGMLEHMLLQFVKNTYAPFIAKPLVKYTITAFSFVFCALGVYAAFGMEAGYDVSDLFPEDSVEHWSLKANMHHFETMTQSIQLKQIDYPGKQKEIMDLYQKLIALKYDDGTPIHLANGSPWLTKYAGYLTMAATAQGLPPTALLDTSFVHPVYAPTGLPTNNSDTFYTLLGGWAKFPPASPTETAYILADQAGLLSVGLQDNSKPPGIDNKITLSGIGVLTRGLTGTRRNLQCIRKTREVIEASPLANHAYPSGVIFTYWETFATLSRITWIAVLVDIVLLFLITAVFLWSIPTAVVVAATSGMIVLEIWGILSLFLKFSFFTSIPLLMAVGLSIEFTAHISAVFTSAKGSTEQKLSKALSIGLPPMVLGAVTTFGAILPLVFSKFPFLRMYFFWTFAVVVAVGVFNAVVVLPSILAALDCTNSFVAEADKDVETPVAEASGTSEASLKPTGEQTGGGALSSGQPSRADPAVPGNAAQCLACGGFGCGRCKPSNRSFADNTIVAVEGPKNPEKPEKPAERTPERPKPKPLVYEKEEEEEAEKEKVTVTGMRNETGKETIICL
jgi:hypothetical protein